MVEPFTVTLSIGLWLALPYSNMVELIFLWLCQNNLIHPYWSIGVNFWLMGRLFGVKQKKGNSSFVQT